MPPFCSYFEDSSDESDGGGESEEAIRQRIAKEFRFGESGQGSRDEVEEAEDDDPLEAFMAGIEVSGYGVGGWVSEWVWGGVGGWVSEWVWGG